MTFLDLKPLTPDLLPAVLDLDRRCFGGLWSLDGYQRELDSPNSELLALQKGLGVREEDGGAEQGVDEREGTKVNLKLQPLVSSPQPLAPLLGLGCYWAILEEAHITILAIDPDYQRQGLGQAMLYALLVSARQRGLERATLEVRISNQSALLLYEKFGFQEVGRRRRYYQDTGEDALVLWLGKLQTSSFLMVLENLQQQIIDRLHCHNWSLSSCWSQPVDQTLRLT